MTATTSVSITVSSDSLINWYTNCLRLAPTVFRKPTSLARFMARAVDRFT